MISFLFARVTVQLKRVRETCLSKRGVNYCPPARLLPALRSTPLHSPARHPDKAHTKYLSLHMHTHSYSITKHLQIALGSQECAPRYACKHTKRKVCASLYLQIEEKVCTLWKPGKISQASELENCVQRRKTKSEISIGCCLSRQGAYT